jgi:predicted dehydrogenase
MVRVGFIGVGHNGRAHIEAHRRLGLSDVAAICDANAALLEKVSRDLGISRAFHSAEELCAEPDIDAVSIHTGDPFHKEPFLTALKHGKHILIEKPLANTVEDVAEMVAATRAADLKLRIAVGYILRFNPVFEGVHELCRSGKLGKIYYLEGDYIHNLLYQAGQTDPATGVNWYLRFEKPLVGGGSHPLDLLRWFSGGNVIEAAGYSAREAFPAMREDDCQVALFRFDTGAIAKVAALYGPRMDMAAFYNLRVYGTLGTVERDTVAISKDADDIHPPFQPVMSARLSGHPYEPEIRDWLEAIRLERPPRCDLFDGANSTVATLVAAQAMAARAALPVPVYARS